MRGAHIKSQPTTKSVASDVAKHGICLIMSSGSKAKSNNSCGHGFYGLQFMYLYGSNSPPPSCCCNHAKCEEIGYSHEGNFQLPNDFDHLKMAFDMLISEDPKHIARVFENPASYRVALWHANSRHHFMSSATGEWTSQKRFLYKGADGKVFHYLSLNYSSQQFIYEKMIGRTGRGRNKDKSLPSWVCLMVKAEQSVSTFGSHHIDDNTFSQTF